MDLFSPPRIEEEELIAREYQAVVDLCARLYSFATAPAPYFGSDVDRRQTELAVSDLVQFSLHARRLIDGCKALSLSRNVFLTEWRPRIEGDDVRFQFGQRYLSFRRFVGAVIHHKTLNVFRTPTEFLIIYRPESWAEYLTLKAYSFELESIQPVVFVASDRVELVSLNLAHSLEVFMSDLLHPIVEFCYDRQIYLEDDS